METFTTYRKDHNNEFESPYICRPLSIGNLNLAQFRDCHIHHQLEIVAHRAGDYAFIYHLSGNGYLHMGMDSYPINQSQYLCAELSGRLRIRNINSSHPLRVMVIRIHDASNKLHLADWLGLDRSEPFDSIYGIDDGSMRGLIGELQTELMKKDRFASVMAESLVRQIAVKMYRAHSTDDIKTTKVPDRIQSRSELVKLAIQTIEHHLYEMKELNQLAQKLGYSYSHISHVFRDEMGQSLQMYWIHQRAKQAMKLLQEGEMNISQIADMLHYQSVHSFSKAFKKIAGMTPREYQRIYQS